jgi:hypothetical protein
MRAKKTRDLEAALTQKGFRPKEGDHTFYFLYVNEKKTSIRTKISHGIDEYGPGLLSQMSKQLHLPPQDFHGFVECPISYRQYLHRLVQQEILSADTAGEQLELKSETAGEDKLG